MSEGVRGLVLYEQTSMSEHPRSRKFPYAFENTTNDQTTDKVIVPASFSLPGSEFPTNSTLNISHYDLVNFRAAREQPEISQRSAREQPESSQRAARGQA